MNTDKKLKHKEITNKVFKAFYKVYNVFGYGFLEKIYERALMIELKKLGLKCNNQQALEVYYYDEIIGNYFSDIIVEDKVLIELKSIKSLSIQDESQLLNYLSCTELEVGLLLNFGPKPQAIRKVFDNERKPYIRAIKASKQENFEDAN